MCVARVPDSHVVPRSGRATYRYTVLSYSIARQQIHFVIRPRIGQPTERSHRFSECSHLHVPLGIIPLHFKRYGI